VNKSFLKFVTDFGPLAIFFFYYYNSGKNLSVAIPPLIVATLVALAVVWFFEKKIPICGVLGGGYNKDFETLVRLHAILHKTCASVIWKKILI